MASTSWRTNWVVFTWVVLTWVGVLCGPVVEGTSTIVPATTASMLPISTTEPVTTASTEPTSTTEPVTTASTVPTSTKEPVTTASTVPTSTPETVTTQSTGSTSTAEPVTTAFTVPASTARPVITDPVTTASTVPTTKPPDCQNGGHRNGSMVICICLIGFSGDLCQHFSDYVKPDVVKATVIVEMVVKQVYKPEYNDNKSPEYKDFVKNFTAQMTSYYKTVDIMNFEGVIVTKVSPAVSFVRRLRSDGVNVEHDIVVSVNNDNNADFEAQYKDILQEISLAVVDLISCKKGNPDCPDFEIDSNTAVTPPKDLGKDICANIIPDAALLEFYEAQNTSGWSCVSICNKNHTDPKNCLNNGVCNIYRGIGPICECANVGHNWYLGDDCSSPINKVGLYAGLSTTLLVLFLTVGALSGYLYFNKQRQNRKRDVKESLVKEWLDEDVVWPKSTPLGTYSNPSFSADPTSRQGRYPIQTPPRGTTASSIGASDSRQNQLQLYQSSINQPMQIRRPQIRVGGAGTAAGPVRQLEIVYRSPEERGNLFIKWDDRLQGDQMYDI